MKTTFKNLLKTLISATKVALFMSVFSGAMSGCDWIQFSFINSIPFKASAEGNPDVYIYLGVDGLSYHTVQDAMIKGGAFSSPDWKLSKLITAFPGTSDYSWTRILHTEKLGGYEIEYYDPTKDVVSNHGILGLAKHIAPDFGIGPNFEFEYLKAFDYRANGFLHSLEAYRDTFVSIGESLDNLFFLLSGRIQTAPVFSAYLLEYDVMGHMQTPQDTTRALKMLSDRIEKFIKNHPERRIHFTLISDHGMDFIRVKGDRFVRMSDELSKVGITPVDSLIGHDPKKELYAIPIMHTRVTYVALHTHPDLIQEVAGRVSNLASVDLAISTVKAPEKAPAGSTSPLEWTGIWADGKIAIQFGFDPTTNQYFFPAHQNYARLDVPLQEDQDLSMSDDALFALMKDRKYPDLFYRARTSIAPVGLEHPADVLVSFKPTFCSLGFSLPGADDIASAGFHGAMEELGTLGTLLTNERIVPDAVRADTVLDLFPKFKQHIRDIGASYVEGDPNASLKNL